MLSPTQSVLGAILLAPEKTLHIARRILSPNDFNIEYERAIFKAACTLADSGKTVTPYTIQTECGRAGINISDEYITGLFDMASTAANIETDCSLVRDKAITREMQSLLENVNYYTSPQETAAGLIEGLTKISERASGASLVSSMESIMSLLNYRGEMEKGNKKTCVKTGFTALDNILGGGLMNEGLYILAARPGVGKTTFALNIAKHVAGKRVPILFISLEMSIDQLNARRFAMETGIPANMILNSVHLPESDTKKLIAASVTLSDEPIYFNQSEGASVADIRALAQSRKDIGLIIIDYLGLIQHSEGKTLYEKVTATSGALKRLARSIGVPILCLAQLNREGEQAPSMAHLRDSGAIEQDADGIILLHSQGERPEDETAPTYSQAILAKNRHGRTGTVTFSFYLRNGKFHEERQHDG